MSFFDARGNRGGRRVPRTAHASCAAGAAIRTFPGVPGLVPIRVTNPSPAYRPERFVEAVEEVVRSPHRNTPTGQLLGVQGLPSNRDIPPMDTVSKIISLKRTVRASARDSSGHNPPGPFPHWPPRRDRYGKSVAYTGHPLADSFRHLLALRYSGIAISGAAAGICARLRFECRGRGNKKRKSHGQSHRGDRYDATR